MLGHIERLVAYVVVGFMALEGKKNHEWGVWHFNTMVLMLMLILRWRHKSALKSYSKQCLPYSKPTSLIVWIMPINDIYKPSQLGIRAPSTYLLPMVAGLVDPWSWSHYCIVGRIYMPYLDLCVQLGVRKLLGILFSLSGQLQRLIR